MPCYSGEGRESSEASSEALGPSGKWRGLQTTAAKHPAPPHPISIAHPNLPVTVPQETAHSAAKSLPISHKQCCSPPLQVWLSRYGSTQKCFSESSSCFRLSGEKTVLTLKRTGLGTWKFAFSSWISYFHCEIWGPPQPPSLHGHSENVQTILVLSWNKLKPQLG